MLNYSSIYINNEFGNMNFKFYYNEKTTFQDLFEIIEYIFPNRSFCDCFQFQYLQSYNYNYYNRNNNWQDLKNNEKVKSYIDSNCSFRIVKKNGIEKCSCSKIYKKYIKKSKNEIISLLEENIKIAQNEKKKNVDLENRNYQNESKINKYEIEINRLNKEITELNKRINELKETIEKLKVEKELLEIEINGDAGKINQLKKFGIIGKYLKPKENIIEVDKNGKYKSNLEKYQKPDFMNFYDVIINIKSIKDITKGWEIKMSKRAEEKYENFKKEEIIKIGVIGNSNKGKSFLLSRISKINLPSGTSIRTEGLSIKYPEINDKYQKRNIALLDSAGLETPVLDEEHTIQDTANFKEFFREKSREKLITELFLQNYIIHNSDILIVVVGILTYSEQKLLNKIKTEIEREKLTDKPLFIIHNLITYSSIEQVEDYIKEYLLNSVTFNLKEGHYTSTKRENKTGKYFYEQGVSQKIFHLIFANEGSEAGNYYNNLTLDFLENSYQTVTNLKPFDVINTVKKRFVSISKEILEKTEKDLSENDFDDSNKNIIILKEKSNVALKKCLIDELGFSNLKGNGFNPNFNYYLKDNNKIILKIEAAGNSSITSTSIEVGEYTCLKIKGNKKIDKEPEKLDDNLFNSREFGEFFLNIYLKQNDNKLLLKNEPPKIWEKKGILFLEYQLEAKNEGGKFEVEDEI